WLNKQQITKTLKRNIDYNNNIICISNNKYFGMDKSRQEMALSDYIDCWSCFGPTFQVAEASSYCWDIVIHAYSSFPNLFVGIRTDDFRINLRIAPYDSWGVNINNGYSYSPFQLRCHQLRHKYRGRLFDC